MANYFSAIIVLFCLTGLACSSESSEHTEKKKEHKNEVMGFMGLFCPGPNGTTLFSCEKNCQQNHNSRYGNCGNAADNDYSCYCSQPLLTVNTNSIQCVDRRYRKRYDAICRTDCLCQHGALDFTCNYETHACECEGQSLSNKLCPFKTLQEVAEFIITREVPGASPALD